jgi:crotonobetainyl-CoA:carnitine CoA-transferase CaiB-like acyl-CoA transferase
VQQRTMILPMVAEIVGRHTLAEMSKIAEEIEISFAPVARPGDLFADPQLNANGRALQVQFPNGKCAPMPRLPVEIGEHDFALRRQAPEPGQHTREIMVELGYSDGEISALVQKGAVLDGRQTGP